MPQLRLEPPSTCPAAPLAAGVQRGLVGEIISRFERKGFKLVGLKLFQATKCACCPPLLATTCCDPSTSAPPGTQERVSPLLYAGPHSPHLSPLPLTAACCLCGLLGGTFVLTSHRRCLHGLQGDR